MSNETGNDMPDNGYTESMSIAMKSRDLQPQPEFLENLKVGAGAKAKKNSCPAFDASKYESDRLRSEACCKAKQDCEQLEHAMLYAAADVRDRTEDLATKQARIAKPRMPRLLMCAAGVVLAVTIAPTAHDFIFITMSDDLLNWFASMVTASVIAAFIVVGILADIDTTQRIAAKKGFLAGIVITVGLGILRVSQATNFGEIAFTGALTIIEIGVIVLLEWRAAALRSAFAQWTAHQNELSVAQARLEAAQASLAHLQEQHQSLKDAIADHIRYVDDRNFRHFNMEQIANEAIQSAANGYNAGIAMNRGRALGANSED